MGLKYCGIRVRELDRSLRFYTEGLGLVERRRGRMRHGGVWVLLQDPRTRQRLELNWYPPGSPYATRYVPGEGLDHLGYTSSRPKVIVERLLAAGGTLALDPRGRNGVPGIYYVADPDGNWVEIFG